MNAKNIYLVKQMQDEKPYYVYSENPKELKENGFQVYTSLSKPSIIFASLDVMDEHTPMKIHFELKSKKPVFFYKENFPTISYILAKEFYSQITIDEKIGIFFSNLLVKLKLKVKETNPFVFVYTANQKIPLINEEKELIVSSIDTYIEVIPEKKCDFYLFCEVIEIFNIKSLPL